MNQKGEKNAGRDRGWKWVFSPYTFFDSPGNNEVVSISVGRRTRAGVRGAPGVDAWLSHLFEGASPGTVTLAEIFFSSNSRGEMEMKALLEGIPPGDVGNFLRDLKKRVSVFKNPAGARYFPDGSADEASLREIFRMAGMFIQEGKRENADSENGIPPGSLPGE